MNAREVLFLGGPLDGEWRVVEGFGFVVVKPGSIGSFAIGPDPIDVMGPSFETIDYRPAGRWAEPPHTFEVWTPNGVRPPNGAVLSRSWDGTGGDAPPPPVVSSPPVDLPSPDAMRLDASRAEADAELAEWRAFVEGMKERRRG